MKLKPLKQWQTLVVLLLYACILCQSLPQLRPSQRLSFTNLRDFITQLKTSSTLSRESLDNIKTNIQNIGKIEQPPPEVTTPPTRRPPYMFQGTESTLPSTVLANMAGFANEKLPSIFNFAKTTQSSTTTTSTTTTSSPFSMPHFFGALLTASPEPELIEEITEEMVENGNLETTKIHHHHFHHYDQESPSDMTQWYMEHMSQILTTSDSVSASEIMPNFSSIASSPSLSGLTTTVRPTTSERTSFIFDSSPQKYEFDASPQKYEDMPMNLVAENWPENNPEISSEIDRIEKFQTCPSHCACTCPQVEIDDTSSGVKKVDLDISLLPCARTAVYQLDLAIKLCKRK